jgi:hypothetical protein
MYINDYLIYFALHKTGCTHVLKLLNNIPGLNGKEIGKHNNIYDVPAAALSDFEKKIKCGNVRNPWNWYVSLWAFGCMKKGGLYDQLARKSFLRKIKKPTLFFESKNEWQIVYANHEDPALFRRWLKMVLVEKRNEIAGFGNNSIPDFMGLMTYRYLHLYTYHFEQDAQLIKQIDDITAFDRKNNFINFFIRNENLEADFADLVRTAGIMYDAIENTKKISKTNTSNRTHYSAYYDEETRLLVAEQEQFIIKKHSYEFNNDSA